MKHLPLDDRFNEFHLETGIIAEELRWILERCEHETTEIYMLRKIAAHLEFLVTAVEAGQITEQGRPPGRLRH